MVSIVGYLHRFREDTGIGEVPRPVEHRVRVIVEGFFSIISRVEIRILRIREGIPP